MNTHPRVYRFVFLQQVRLRLVKTPDAKCFLLFKTSNIALH